MNTTTTTTKYRYILDNRPGRKEDICPNCGKRRYVHYIDTQTGKPLPYQYGRCNRENKCRYWLNPYTDGYSKEDKTSRRTHRVILNPFSSLNKPERDNYPTIPIQALKSTLIEPLRSTFAQKLIGRYGRTSVEAVLSKYLIGSYRDYTTFPYIDGKGVQAIQCKRFMENLHTDRGEYGTTWLHVLQKKDSWTEEYKKRGKVVTCMFGQHLLRLYPDHPVVLVEAPKSAIVGMLQYGLPENGNPIWLATFNSGTYTEEKVSCLAGRRVTVFADTSTDDMTFKEWERRTQRFETMYGGTWNCSNILQEIASDEEKKKGYDIADYLLAVPVPKREPTPAPAPAPAPEPVSVSESESVSVPEPVHAPEPVPISGIVPKIGTTLNGISEERRREIEAEFNVKTEQDYIFANYLFDNNLLPLRYTPPQQTTK